MIAIKYIKNLYSRKQINTKKETKNVEIYKKWHKKLNKNRYLRQA